MKAAVFWRTVVADESNFLDRILALLSEHGLRYCLIGGQAVNAYADPVVSLDLDVAIALEQIPEAERLLDERFHVERFPHSLNVSDAGSDLRVQIQTDPRYSAFVNHAESHSVLGQDLRVAKLEDVLQGKIWAAADPSRRTIKRLKDFADIARLLEVRPDLIDRVPEEMRQRIR
jgi:hypothetical protein